MLAVSRQSDFSGRRRPRANWIIFALALSTPGCDGLPIEPILPWARHTIDNSSSGADGVRGADINGDGWLDLVTSWEESGEVKVYIHPGADGVRLPWPSVIIANVGAVEDAVFVDLDEDGVLDVVSSAEGSVRSIFVHFAPSDLAQLLDAEAWQTQALPAARNQRQWMFCAPADIDGRHGVDLIAGAKEDGAMLGWFEAPSAPRNLAAWTWHPIAEVGWVMSIIPHDVNGDGAIDVIATDRKGSMRGCWWFENPGQPEASFDLWPRHLVGGAGENVMFADLADLNGDSRDDLVAATDAHRLLLFLRQPVDSPAWSTQPSALGRGFGTGKGVRAGDINGDGRPDIVFSSEHAGGRTGVGWLANVSSEIGTLWLPRAISGSAGGKFDLIQLADLDGDGDLDVLTTEEVEGLGVIWYENPHD